MENGMSYRKQLEAIHHDEILQDGFAEKITLDKMKAVAIKPLNKGLPIDLIVQLTDLSVDQIKALQQKIKK